jgi:hypothetical protein
MFRWLVVLTTQTCVATLLAQGLGLGYLVATGKLNREKTLRILAVIHDVDLAAADRTAVGSAEKESQEQPSFEDIERRRALESHILETKRMALEKGLEEVRLRRELLALDLEQIQRLQAGFNKRLDTLQEQLTLEGIARQRQIWTKIEPALAKEQIMNMVDSGEIDDVVVLLSDMPSSNQARIISEFEMDDVKQREAMDEILRKIRRGLPAVSLIDEARQELSANQRKES